LERKEGGSSGGGRVPRKGRHLPIRPVNKKKKHTKKSSGGGSKNEKDGRSRKTEKGRGEPKS